eukprot:6211062-Pyramimonas_sp.AAC.1
MHSLSDTDAVLRELRANGSSALDGFSAAIVHMHGYSLVAITYYGFCSEGFGGRNLARLAKLGALVSQLRLPWFIVGDFNLEPEVLVQRGFIQKVDG